MSKRFRTCDLNQVFLLPPSLQDWLPEGHLARFIAEVTNALDLSKIMAAYHPAIKHLATIVWLRLCRAVRLFHPQLHTG